MTQPEKRLMVGNITASIFRNASKTDNNPELYKTVSLQKSFLDKADNRLKYSDSISLNMHEIPKVILALEKAYEYLMLRRR